jgi:membrane-associated phospholipid phosphatase
MAIWAAVGADSRFYGYAVERTPVYGSGERAGRAGNVFIYASVGIAAAVYAVRYFDEFKDIGGLLDGCCAATCPPAGNIAYRYPANRPSDYLSFLPTSGQPSVLGRPLSAAEAVGAFALSCAATSTATEIIKKQVGRPRPDFSDSLSYPSGHATVAAWANRSAAQMIDGLGLPQYVRYTANATLALLTVGAAWGRVESGRHYVSDVMAGIWVGMALTDASFSLYRDKGGDYTGGVSFGFRMFNDNGAAATLLSTTLNF